MVDLVRCFVVGVMRYGSMGGWIEEEAARV